MLDAVAQEIDIPTGLVLFQWDSLDHVGLNDSHVPTPKFARDPYDYFHINSVEQDPHGNLVGSARDTWSICKVSHQTGSVIWQLGGKHSSRADAKPTTLSGGERQRVALARAVAPRPDVLLLDEPLSALDARTRASASRELAATLNSLELPVVLVTHDFHEAALLGDEIGVIDDGTIIQRGSASDLAAAPATAFVADFTGAVVLTGTTRASDSELTIVDIDGGGVACTTDAGHGRVALSIFPWEITISQAPDSGDESAQSRLTAQITSVTTVGNRVRLGLAAGQPLVAEITAKSIHDLHLTVGREVTATWKATATRLVAL